jgi:NUDIX domain
MQKVSCRKVIAAPFIYKDNDIHFLIVKDRTHKEWTFITGGCKAHESDLQSAVRELLEETKNVVSLDCIGGAALRMDFTTTYREPHQRIRDQQKGELVVTTYSMFFFDITHCSKPPTELRSQFRSIKNVRGAFNENLDITFETLESFLSKNFVWRFIKQVVVRTPAFAQLVDKIRATYGAQGGGQEAAALPAVQAQAGSGVCTPSLAPKHEGKPQLAAAPGSSGWELA